MAITVFCDDAGFTGDNLLQPEQPFFGFAAVAVEPDEAAEFVRRLRDRFSVVGGELSGRRLYLRPDAAELISWLLGELGDRASVAVHEKLFSLAGKFFEYVYEPILARDSRFLYELGFHLHVANVIHAHLEHGDAGAARIAQRFEGLLRRRGGEPAAFFEADGIDTRDAMSTISRFVVACRPAIEAEVSGLADEAGRIKWVLDLSLGSAQSVLRTMGERFGALDVTFDESKPLEAYRHFFDVLVGRKDNPMFGLQGRERRLIFELARPVRFGVSAKVPGLQLADVVASFSTLASRDRRSDKGREVFGICVEAFNEESVWPDIEQLRLERKENFLNAILMAELADRAEAGGDPLVGLREFYEFASWRYDVDPPVGMDAHP